MTLPPVPIASLNHTLHLLRRSASTCRLAAYCDLGAHLVLRHEAEPAVRQELLDRLSEEAFEAFQLRDRVAAVFPQSTGDESRYIEDISVSDDRGIRLFLRNPHARQDALILLCANPAEAETLRSAAAQVLRDVAARQAEGSV